MNYTIIESNGLLTELGIRLSKLGHSVTTLPISPSSTILSTKPDIVLFESAENGKTAESLIKQGVRVLFSSIWASTINTNKEYKKSFLIACGLNFKDSPQINETYLDAWFNGNKFSCITKWEPMLRVGAETLTALLGESLSTKHEYYTDYLKPLENGLKKQSYRGPVGLTISGGGFVTGIHVGITSMVSSFMEGLKTSLEDFLSSMCLGTNGNVTDKFYAQIPFTVLGDLTSDSGIRKHIWRTHNGAVATAHGTSPRECFRRIFRTLYGDMWMR